MGYKCLITNVCTLSRFIPFVNMASKYFPKIIQDLLSDAVILNESVPPLLRVFEDSRVSLNKLTNNGI